MGCKSSKDASQPGSRKAGQNESSPPRSAPRGLQSPGKSPYKAFKDIPEAELKKHKVSDIIGFVKTGNLAMVHGLIKHYQLGQSVLLLKGMADEFPISKTQKISMADWNPLLVAVAFKRIDVVRYFLYTLKISLRHAGKKPLEVAPTSQDELAQMYIFSLVLAISHKDLPMFKELWAVHTAWDQEHLQKVFLQLVQEGWKEGLQEFFKSYTTDVIFSSQIFEKQAEIVTEWFRIKKEQTPEISKIINENLLHKPYSLIAIFVLLKDQAELATQAEKKTFIEKAHLDISAVQYGHFKFSNLYEQLREAMTAFEALGDPEKASIKLLSDSFEKHDGRLQEEQAFSSLSEYEILQAKQIDAYRLADVEALREIVSKYEIRRVPFSEGYNYESYYPELNNLPYYYWSALVHMLHQKVPTEDKMIEVYKYVLTSGFNIRQGLLQTNQKGVSDESAPRIPPMLGISLLVSIEKGLWEVYKYLWNEDFINIWSPKHFNMVNDVLIRYRYNQLIDHHLNSVVGTNCFLTMSQQERFNFVQNTYLQFDKSYEVLNALSQKYYAPYLLLLLIERDTFMKMDDFTFYNRCLENSSQYDLELLSTNKEYEEGFIKFAKYIDILDQADQKKTEGQKLIQTIFSLDKFKHLQNVSLQVFDQESVIFEEEGVEESAHKVQVGQSLQTHQARSQIKDINLEDFYRCFTDFNEAAALEILKNFKLQDLLYYRGLEGSTGVYWRLTEDKLSFEYSQKDFSRYNLFHLGVHHGFNKFTNYILNDLKVMTASRQTKNIDPRIILMNEEDETYTLRTAVINEQPDTFFQLWDTYSFLYDDRDMLVILRFIIFLSKWNFLERFLQSKTTQNIFLNAPLSARQSFVQLFDRTVMDNASENVRFLIAYDPYTRLEKSPINEGVLQQMYNLIRDNEVDHLAELINEQEIRGVAQIVFDFFQEDEEVLNLADDSKVTVSILNPILLAIKYKSFATLKYLVDKFGIRQSLQPLDIIVRTAEGEYPFKTLIMPILLKIKDVDSLNFLLKQPGFFFHTQDFNSFVTYAFEEKWLPGLKHFLASPSAHFFFQAMSFDEQKIMIERIVKAVQDIEDVKVRKNYSISLVEDVLTKKPYTKPITMILLNGGVPRNIFDVSKIARECLKNLSSEDLFHLFLEDKEGMGENEKRYNDITGNTVENELSKIMMRYANEGRPAWYQYSHSESRKQVRFDGLNGSQFENENRI